MDTKSARYTLFPIQDETSYRFFQMQVANFWTAEELDFSRDVTDYASLPEYQKEILNRIFAFFSAADGVVIENIGDQFLADSTTLEQRYMYQAQGLIEAIHSQTYSLIIDTLVQDKSKKQELFEAADRSEAVKEKNSWMEKYMDKATYSRAHRLVAFACAEGIFFPASFLIIFYYKSSGLLPNVVFANSKISQDETLHRDFGCALYKEQSKRGKAVEHGSAESKTLSREEVVSIVSEAVEIEKRFVDWVLSEPIRNDEGCEELTAQQTKRFVEYIGNALLVKLGYETYWDVSKKSFPEWIREICATAKGNFYEVRTGNYKQYSLQGTQKSKAENDFDDDVDF
jgi:ribonucleotide reductase beta subunit family protein with ferritin-like domain